MAGTRAATCIGANANRVFFPNPIPDACWRNSGPRACLLEIISKSGFLLSNTPAAGAALPSPNNCAGHGFNCAILVDTTIHEIVLSSQDETGLKIPPGQVLGGPIQVVAGQSVDLNIDFNVCASLKPQKDGTFRLKPTLTGV